MLLTRRLAAALTLLAAAVPPALGQSVVTLENPTLAQPLAGPNAFQNGSTLSPAGSFTTGGATFNNTYTAAFDSWSGWAYSNVTNLTTAGFTNQYAAYNVSGGGTGDGSANYAVASAFAPGDSTIALPAGQRALSARVTNTTYAALSIRDGDPFAKKFGGASGNDPDFFRLTVTGRDAQNAPTGSVEFYLADFRFADNARDYTVKDWTTLDLTGLGVATTTLSFGLDSSDVGAFGMNTPAYFALDNLALTPVPEPAAVGVVAAAGLVALRRRRPRR